MVTNGNFAFGGDVKNFDGETEKRRQKWVEKINKVSGSFNEDSDRIQKDIEQEIQKEGVVALIDHLRTCGTIPEIFLHDSTQEKLYSKYTDIVLSCAFSHVGYKCLVLTERADAADVEIFGESYDMVADAKAFRLSRTAKNQKDFKVQAMDTWKHGKKYAILICPIFQLPNRTSQIYLQATSRNVCIFSYSHLAILVSLNEIEGSNSSQELLLKILNTIPAMNPSKDAGSYWLSLNKIMLEHSSEIDKLWKDEKQAAVDSITYSKTEALGFLAGERKRIMQLSHEEAIKELIEINKIKNKENIIKAVKANQLMDVR